MRTTAVVAVPRAAAAAAAVPVAVADSNVIDILGIGKQFR